VREPQRAVDASASETPVSALELFFDLVFVFTITQLTGLLARDPSVVGVLQVVLIFGNVWWMYGGYAWLTNAVPPRKLGGRLLLLVGMGGFLVVAIAIPTTFAGGGLAFGLGYLVVTLVHTGIFLRTSQQSVLRSMVGLGPFNLGTAGLLVAAGRDQRPAPVGALWRRVRAALGHAAAHQHGRLQDPPPPLRGATWADPVDRDR